MPILLRTGAGLAMSLALSFNSVAEDPPLTNQKAVLTSSALPAQEQAVTQAVSAFRDDFAQRVQSNDTSDSWNNCFTIGRGRHKSVYRISDVVNLRYKVALNKSPESASYTKPVIILDPGHGHEMPGSRFGYDAGTISAGLQEVQVIDSVVQPLKEKLESELGAIVITTRDPIKGDLSLLVATSKFSNQESALQIRAEMTSYLVQKFPNAPIVFVSLHGNHGHGSGAQVYYYGADKNAPTDSDPSRELARSIGANYQLRSRAETKTLTNDYAVLRCQYKTTPSVLIELGFLDNAKDRAAFRDTDQISTQIASGIGSYLDKNSRKRELPQMQVASNSPP